MGWRSSPASTASAVCRRSRPGVTSGRSRPWARCTPVTILQSSCARIPLKRERIARLPRLSPELVRTEAHQLRMAKLAVGIESIESFDERSEALVDMAHRAARQGRAVYC